MQQFFVTADQVQENQIYIEGTDVNHMKNVLRMRPGEKLGKIRGCTGGSHNSGGGECRYGITV